MELKEQINKAIGAHGAWKARLRAAIDTGSSDFKPEIVQTDNQCEFGKWLHNEGNAEIRKMPVYKTVVQYHAEFHKEAARVLTLAVSGKKDEAEEAMKAGSKFAIVSSSLTSTMMEWRNNVD